MTSANGSRDSGRTAILIAGGHRSGVSVLAGLLARLGVAVSGAPAAAGAGAMEPDPFGRLLAGLGISPGDWASPGRDAAPAIPDSSIASLVGAAEPERPVFALADPRLARTVRSFAEALRRAGAAPVAFVPYRHPAAAAPSLAAAAGITPEEALLVWLREALDAEAATRDMPRSFVSLDRLLADWRREAARLSRETGVGWPDLSVGAAAEVDAFIDPARIRHRADNAAAPADALSARALEVFDTLESLSAGPGGAPVEARLDALRASLDAAAEVVAPVVAALRDDRSRDALRDAESRLGEARGSLDQLQTRLTRTEQTRNDLEASLAQRERELHGIKRSASWQLTAPLREITRTVNRLRRSNSRDAERLAARKRAEALALLRVPRSEVAAPRLLPAKLIAFYLPQFHPIPENDAFWGKGFTEWTNVGRAVPQFVDHYQPHVPADLGYYDLRVPSVQHEQIALARQYGISAFCFYFYWFGGRRLLEMPLETFASDPEKDFPFLICWANENWTRRWDGREQDVLVAQDHSAADDLAFIAYVARYLRNPRYVRIDGRPLLLVYRPAILPSATETAARWRTWCRDNGIGEIYLAFTQSFGRADPKDYGFDAAIEFPPNATGVRQLRDAVVPLAPDFECKIYDMADLVARSRDYKVPPYRLYRGVSPSWDNTARKGNKSDILVNASPEGFREWVGNAVADTRARFHNPDHHLVFVNAWNEWAEGAHLEPDQRYGFAWLAAARDALADVTRRDATRRLVLVAHDAHEHGAQMLCASIARTLSRTFGMALDIVLLGEGPLAWRLEECGTVHRLVDADPSGAEARALATRLAASGSRTAIVNTAVSGLFLATLAQAGIRCVSLVHEMAAYIGQRKLERHAAAIARHASVVVFGAEAVRESFATVVPEIRRHPDTRVRAQGLYKRNALIADRTEARRRLRAQLGIADGTPVILTVGFADRRKGADLFVEAGLKVAEASDAHFVWVGRYGDGMQPLVTKRLAASPLGDRFHFVGFKENTDLYYAGADIYALTSREDPLPTVAFEAMDVGVPVIAFAGAGGIPGWLGGGAGVVVPMADVDALAGAMLDLVRDPAKRAAIGAAGQKIVHERLDFTGYVGDLLDILGQRPPTVSVIVPNYNYARYLRRRLDSILSQTFPVLELIVLDDASTDGSLAVIEGTLAGWEGDARVLVNETNSGSVFAQWRRGAVLARGDYVWIAEADDLAEPSFLDRVIDRMSAEGAALGFSDSFQIDGEDRRIGRSYAKYCDGGDEGRFHHDFTLGGRAFLQECLSVKNTILNVSGVVWKREALLKALAATEGTLESFRTAGDWRLYAEVALADAPVAYVARALNGHRRHAGSVSRALDHRRHYDEIVAMHAFIASRLGGGDEDLLARMRAYESEIAALFGIEP